MENIIGQSFEELDDQEMINIQGGATPTSVTVASSLWCAAASACVSGSVVLTVYIWKH